MCMYECVCFDEVVKEYMRLQRKMSKDDFAKIMQKTFMLFREKLLCSTFEKSRVIVTAVAASTSSALSWE